MRPAKRVKLSEEHHTLLCGMEDELSNELTKSDPPRSILDSIMRFLSDFPRSKKWQDNISGNLLFKIALLNNSLFKFVKKEYTEMFDCTSPTLESSLQGNLQLLSYYGPSVRKMVITDIENCSKDRPGWIQSMTTLCTNLNELTILCSPHVLPTALLLSSLHDQLQKIHLTQAPLNLNIARLVAKHAPNVKELSICVMIEHAVSFTELIAAVGPQLDTLTLHLRDQEVLQGGCNQANTETDKQVCYANKLRPFLDGASTLSLDPIGKYCDKLEKLTIYGDLSAVVTDLAALPMALESKLKYIHFDLVPGAYKFLSNLMLFCPEASISVDIFRRMDVTPETAQHILNETILIAAPSLSSLRFSGNLRMTEEMSRQQAGRCSQLKNLNIVDATGQTAELIELFGRKCLSSCESISVSSKRLGVESCIKTINALERCSGSLKKFHFTAGFALPASTFYGIAAANKALTHATIDISIMSAEGYDENDDYSKENWKDWEEEEDESNMKNGIIEEEEKVEKEEKGTKCVNTLSTDNKHVDGTEDEQKEHDGSTIGEDREKNESLSIKIAGYMEAFSQCPDLEIFFISLNCEFYNIVAEDNPRTIILDAVDKFVSETATVCVNDHYLLR